MQKTKRIYFSISIMVILICSVFFSTGCEPLNKREDYLEEDGFIALINSYPFKTATIIGITNDANGKEELVIPSEISGYKITLISNNSFGNLFDRYQAKKIFIPDNNFYFGNNFVFFPRAAKRVFLSIDIKAYNIGFYHGEEIIDKKGWFPYYFGNLYVAKTKIESYENEYLPLNEEVHFFAANISYFYNFEGAPNEGYYWIDDLDEGQKIKTVPCDPVRDGYNFEGWFTDGNCTMVFDFDTFVKGNSELNLYAKWRI